MLSTVWRMRERVLALAGVTLPLLVVLSSSGCAQATPPPDPVTIAFAHPTVDEAYYQDLVDLFNEDYPHITVDLQPRHGDLLGGIDVGDADVFVTSQFALNWLRGEGSLLDLSPYVEGESALDSADFYPGMSELYTVQGATWAIPAGVDMMVMFYNQDLCDSYGAPYPEAEWTWNEFLQTASLLRDPGANVFGYAPNHDFDPMLFVYQHGGRMFDDLRHPTRTTFDDPLTIEAIEWYARLMNDLNVAPTPAQAREAFGMGSEVQLGVLQDRVGMWTGMLSERGGQAWGTEWRMRWGAAPLPRGERAATLTLVEGYFISAEAEHPDACWQWVAFLSNHLPSRLTPARKSLAESTAYEQQVGEDLAVVARASLEGALLLSPELAEFEQAFGVFQRAVMEVVEGRATADEALVRAQQLSDR